MSERDYIYVDYRDERDCYDEETVRKYRAELVRQRNNPDHIFNNQHGISVLDKMIKELDEKYPNARFKRKSEQLPMDDFQKETRTNLKEKFSNLFGTFGVVLYFIVRLIISTLPFVMIGGNFFGFCLLTTIHYFLPITSVVFWIWGLVCAIKGIQDIWAIMYYIAFALIWIPFFISTIVSMFSKK